MNLVQSEMLVSEALAKDPRIAQAKKLLSDAMRDHQKNIKEIRPTNPQLKKHYESMLENFANYRGAKLWFPYIGSGIGNGALVELADGSVKYDFINGIGPHFFGHSHPEVIDACIDAALSDTVMSGNIQQNADTIELTELLIKQSKVLDHCFLTTTGAMANENAFKLIFQNKYPANRILAFDRCFMGRTLIMSQVTDRAIYREGLPLNLYVDYVPYYDANDPIGSTAHAVATLERHLKRYPKQYAMMCFELIQGDGGFYTGSKEFFLAIIKVLKENNITVFIDEVQTFGRTPSLYAFQHFGLQDYVDVVTVGKLSQVCATLFTKKFKPLPGLLSQTFTSSTSSIRAGTRMINSLINRGFYGPNGKIQQLSTYFMGKLEALASKYPHLVQGPFGMGAMIAFTPFNGESERVVKFVMDLFDEGVMTFITGHSPVRIRFLAPFGVVTFQDIDKVMEIVEKVLTRE